MWFVLALTLACYVFLSNSMGGTVSLSPIGPHRGCLYRGKRTRPRRGSCGCSCGGRVRGGGSMGTSSVAMALVMRIENVAFVVVAALGGFGVLCTMPIWKRRAAPPLKLSERARSSLRAALLTSACASRVKCTTSRRIPFLRLPFRRQRRERLIDLNPAAAKEAIADIRSVSKSSLDEIRSLIGVLRGDEAASMRPPKAPSAWATSCRSCSVLASRSIFDESDYDKAQVPAFVDMALFSLAPRVGYQCRASCPCRTYLHELVSSPSKAVLVFSDDGVGMGSGVREHAEGHGLEGMGEESKRSMAHSP